MVIKNMFLTKIDERDYKSRQFKKPYYLIKSIKNTDEFFTQYCWFVLRTSKNEEK